MSSRKLTQGEIALAKKIFRNSIDYNKVTIHRDKHNALQDETAAVTPNGEIYIPHPNHYQNDFSQTTIPDYNSLFIHEMVHVWQYQNNVLNPIIAAAIEMLRHMFQYHKAYQYTLEEGKDLLDYRIEQQAAIIEDYYRSQYLGAPPVRNRNGHRNIQNQLPPNERMNAFRRVLINFISNPKYANSNMKCSRSKLAISRSPLTCSEK
ncbi:hypothetical protein DU002_13270 [Corallincola holothuriorum]|uniref:DUF4157 domain-containing protein n=1 Tax=Corallincola holothuriorum TaxID=2282215 RepID=A0A368NH80_9GAMM|nr:hypothetical protein [Corallincola holothuriorum]RCU48759.1 hypothetical protein DU002_13270 [Corallincola holothuriorum]